MGLIISLILAPSASADQELALQDATDGVSTAARATLDHLFWRSGFGASVVGGPYFAGDVVAYNNRIGEFSALSNGAMPNGAKPSFLEFNSLAAPNYTSGAGNDTDYLTQRWNFTSAANFTGAWTLGAGAAAEAAWAKYLLRTNHYSNGTQSPAAPYVGASDADGMLGLWLVQALADRVNATRAGAAHNGSALGPFNFTDAALNDGDPSNGWQRVPNGLGVSMSPDPEPLFQGFVPADTTSSLGGQAALIVGLAEIMNLSDPAGPNAQIFDGSPFDGSLHNNSVELLHTVLLNAEAYHWNASASTYAEPDAGSVSTADLALFLRAVAVGEKAATDSALKANLTAARMRAATALAQLANGAGVFPSTYSVNGSLVVPDWSMVSLGAQAGAVEALAAVFATTGLKADWDAMFRAGAGLESPLYYNGSYHAVDPEPVTTLFTASAVSATLGALRDLSLTHEEPLAIYRFINAYEFLFRLPSLLLTGAQTPPVIGASFGWNATAQTYTGATDFASAGAMLASYEFLTSGPEYYAAVGGGVFVTERAALLLHNATATQVGAQIDTLDAQIVALNSQVAALQAAFDALNASVTNVTDRLNLSLENETISLQRIADMQANVTALRAQLNASTVDRDIYKGTLDNMTANLTDLQLRFGNLTVNLTQAREEAARNGGLLNQSKQDLDNARTQLNTSNATLDRRTAEAAAAQQVVGAAVAVSGLVGLVVGIFVAKFVRAPKAPADAPAKGKGESPKPEEDDEDS